MKKVSVIIVEDGIMQADRYADVLRERGIDVTGIAPSFEEGKELIKKSPPDLALIDINLKGSGRHNNGDTSGIELGKWITENYGIPFIYVTAYGDRETLQKASNSGHVSYLYKPVNDEQLYVSVQDGLFKSKFFTFKVNYRDQRIYQNSIIRFESAKNDLLIYTSTQEEPYKTRLQISEIEEQLYDFIFVRCHKSHIININFVIRYTSEHIYIKDFSTEKAIPIGPNYRGDLFNFLNRH